MSKLKKMITDIDTARQLAKVFGDKIYNDLKIMITTTKKDKKCLYFFYGNCINEDPCDKECICKEVIKNEQTQS